ncbi:MAG: winged helix-turn-helix transcriptional regulator [Alphaproteobacteria bacterium]|nr:winged helix-turn-helix transcriptional regulator [Alphaproteobacteria bacterium]
MKPTSCTPTPRFAPATREDAEARLAALCRALGHPARVRILSFLIAQDRCLAGEIADELPQAPSTVSQHLKQLKEAGLICGEIDGPRRSYCVDKGAVAELQALLRALTIPPESQDV